MTFASFDAPYAAGFEVLAGRSQGLQRLMVVAGRLPASDVGIVHVHHGDEVLRVVSGEILVRCGDSRRVCGHGDLIVVPPEVPHGFRVLEETVMEVVAESTSARSTRSLARAGRSSWSRSIDPICPGPTTASRLGVDLRRRTPGHLHPARLRRLSGLARGSTKVV